MLTKRTNNRPVVVVRARRQPLSAVVHHASIAGLDRHLFCSDLLSRNAPAHVAVHYFNGRYRNRNPGTFHYTEAHAHSCWELDIIIPQGRGFVFQLEIEGRVRFIKHASTILIPPGTRHRMEIVRGKGQMVCIVCSGNYTRSLLP